MTTNMEWVGALWCMYIMIGAVIGRRVYKVGEPIFEIPKWFAISVSIVCGFIWPVFLVISGILYLIYLIYSIFDHYTIYGIVNGGMQMKDIDAGNIILWDIQPTQHGKAIDDRIIRPAKFKMGSVVKVDKESDIIEVSTPSGTLYSLTFSEDIVTHKSAVINRDYIYTGEQLIEFFNRAIHLRMKYIQEHGRDD